MAQNNYARPNSRFNNIANEILKTGVPQQQMPYPFPMANSFPPPYGYPMNNFAGYPMPFYPPSAMMLADDDDSDTEEFETMVRLIDKQRDILGRFVKTLDRNKDTLMKDQAKDLNKKIKALEKEGAIRQLKLDAEQGRLIKKLRAPYEFDHSNYKLGDMSDSDDDDDDDILLELLSNKVHFKKVQALIKKKKLQKKLGQVTKRSDSSDSDSDDGESEKGSKKSKRKGTKK